MSAVDPALESMIRNLEAKTGRSLEQWIAVARGLGHDKHKAIVDALKRNHALGHGYANLIAQRTLTTSGAHDGDDLVAAQYSGAKATLKPWYDSIISQVQRFGGDIEIAPKKTYVSLRRRKQFALLQPSTATRLDVGISLKGEPAKGRLEASGSFNAMVSHRVRVEKAGDIDTALIAWLKRAYDAA